MSSSSSLQRVLQRSRQMMLPSHQTRIRNLRAVLDSLLVLGLYLFAYGPFPRFGLLHPSHLSSFLKVVATDYVYLFVVIVNIV